MVRPLLPISEPTARAGPSRLRRALVALFFLLLLQSSLISIFAFADVAPTHRPTMDRQCSEAEAQRPSSDAAPPRYRHLIVLVHGYMGSHREQEYLGEALLAERARVLGDAACRRRDDHEFSMLYSTANEADSTDGVAVGGERLAAEIAEWAREETRDVRPAASDAASTIVTLSVFGNSLGGLYGRHALSRLGPLLDPNDDDDDGRPAIRPLLFCTTSSPHLGVSRETFVELPKRIEPLVSSAFRQRTMDDLFAARGSTVVADMCRGEEYLAPLGRFRKRVAVANAYNTDFLVSVTSGAFLSADSDSVHHHRDAEFDGSGSFRWMRDVEHVALQVATLPRDNADVLVDTGGGDPGNSDGDDNGNGNGNGNDNDENANNRETTQICVDALDDLGWHKIFVDTRGLLPSFANFDIPRLRPKASYASRELRGHFAQYGTLLPVAHPLNMANARTDWYRTLTRRGQPVVDALAELLVRDMIELSEEHMGA